VTAALEAVIRAEIAASGPIAFARYMELALDHPAHGYYASPAARPTRGGDFLTAPELHPIFGATLARQLAEAWERLGRPDPFILREDGAGAGTLGLTVIAGLRADGSGLADALRYAPLELNPHRRAELAERFGAAGLADRLVASAGGAAPDPDHPFVGAIVANELLDALPVHVVEVRGGVVREVLVDVAPDGGFREMLAEPSTPAIGERLGVLREAGVELVEGQRAEFCLALDAWTADVGAALARGLVLVLDYGAAAADLYGPRRRAGTLMTYRGHRADGAPGAPYRDVGERDITAHVDTTTLARLLAARGLDLLGETTQAAFLAGCGLEETFRRERENLPDLAAAFELRSAVRRLLDPRHLGGFRVVLAGRDIPADPPLRGLSFPLPGGRE